MKKLILLICLFVTTNTLFAQAPQGVNYQTVVRNNAGVAIENQSVSIRFTVLQNSVNGTAVYTEIHAATTNFLGLVNLVIGQGNATQGSFNNIDWATGPYFIQTEVDIAGGSNYVVAGTQQLMSVPYALYAASSGSSIAGPAGPQGIQGLPGQDGAQGAQGTQGIQGVAGSNGLNTLVKTTTEVAGANCTTGGVKLEYGIDANSNGVLDVSEINATLTKYVCNGLTGATGAQGIQGLPGQDGAPGTAGQNGILPNGAVAGNTPYWNGTTWVTNSSNIFNNGSHVGIGTSSPNVSAITDISSNTQGFLLPRMTAVERNNILNPANGLFIFNLTTGCPNYFWDGVWYNWCGTMPVPPNAPLFLSSSPTSPSSTILNPSLVLSSSAGNTINLYQSGNCSGAAIATALVDINGTVTIPVTVASNSTTSYTASATDVQENVSACSSVFIYTHDNIAPLVPAITGSIPVSPSRTSITPSLIITGEVGTTVKIYRSGSCSGAVQATGVISAGGGGSVSIPVTAASNSTTQYTASLTDAAGNVSACSNVFEYTHDNVPPSAPVITSSTPSSPSNTSTTLSLTVTGEVGATVRIYISGSCSGAVQATGVIGVSGSVSISVTVAPNSTTQFTANVIDAAGNLSACSNVFSYTYDNIPPATPAITGSTPVSPNASTTPSLIITGEVGATVRVYKSGSCTGAVQATGVIGAGGSVSIPVTVASNSTTQFTVSLIDAAGNVSACSSVFAYTSLP
jgi:hypothetical protein